MPHESRFLVLTREEHDHWKEKAYHIARRAVPTYPLEDMVAAGMESLVTSLRTYDPSSKKKKTNYVLQHMRWAMLDAARAMTHASKREQDKGVVYTEVPLDRQVFEIGVPPAVSEDRIDLELAVERLTPRRRAFLKAYLEEDDVVRAALRVGLSEEGGRNMYWKTVRTLRAMLKEH